MSRLEKKPSLWEMLLQHVIVFLICVVFPGATTMLAPATWLTFERQGAEVQCTTRTCAFFVVPFKTQRVSQVTEVTHRERAGRTERKSRHGRTTNEYVHVDGEGFLQIHGGAEQHAEVSVSPTSLESVVAKCNAFLNSSQEVSTTMFVIANWKFGGIMGGVLSLFTLLYVVGYALGFVKLICSLASRILPSAQTEQL